MGSRIVWLIATGTLTLVLVILSIYVWTRSEGEDVPTLSQHERGQALFQSKGCASCHHLASRGVIVGFGAGPDLSNLSETATLRAGDQTAEAYVRASILNPQAYIVPGYTSGPGMPALSVSPVELEALIVFLLDPAGSDPVS